jgi:hypothetical protein
MENDKDKLSRLEMMANDKYGKWDLSDNDIEAIKYAIEKIKSADRVSGQAETQVSQTSELTCEQKLNDLANEFSKEVIDKYKFIAENKEPLIEGVLDEAEIEWFLYFKEKIKSFCEQP